MASQKVSKSSYYSKHIIQSEGDLELENPATIIKSEAVAEDFDSGSLQVNGGVSIKKNLLVDGPVGISGPVSIETLTISGPSTMSSLDVENIDVDNLVINESVTFSDGEIYIKDLKVSDIKVNSSITLNGDKHISFQDDEFYEATKFFSWHSFSFAKGDALNALHPYSFRNASDALADVFMGLSSHTIEEPGSSNILTNINVAGIDKDGVYQPTGRDQDNIVTANVVLEMCLNPYFSGSGAQNSESRISIDKVRVLFKDTDNFSSLSTNTLFCTTEVLYRTVLLGTGDLEVNSIEFLGSNDLIDNQISIHTVNLSTPLSIKLSPFAGQIAYLRITLYNSIDTATNGPRFIGAYVDYKTNQITPS